MDEIIKGMIYLDAEPEINIDEFNSDELEPELKSRAISSEEWLSKSKKEEPKEPKKKKPKIRLIEQETGILFNEFERSVHIWSVSKRVWRYMERMGIKPYKETSECKFYDLESKHQIIIKKKPAKKARSSSQSCTI